MCIAPATKDSNQTTKIVWILKGIYLIFIQKCLLNWTISHKGYVINENFRMLPHKQNKYWVWLSFLSSAVKSYSYQTGRRILKTNSLLNIWIVCFVHKIFYISVGNYFYVPKLLGKECGNKIRYLGGLPSYILPFFQICMFCLAVSKVRTKGQWSSP